MAVEKNPNEEIAQNNVINLDIQKENVMDNVSFELDPETGELEVEFESDITEEVKEEQGTFYENLADLMEEEDLQDIAGLQNHMI